MAGVKPRLAFRFDGRPSAVRSTDIRFRVAAVSLLSAAILSAEPWSLVPLGVLVAALLFAAKSTVGEAARVIRGFLGFLAFFVGLGFAFEPTGTNAVFLLLQAARLSLLLLAGHVLYLSATPADVTDGIRWYLAWLGRRRAWAAASMAAWALSSVPMVLDQASTLLEASALRGLDSRRHPLRMLKLLTLALLVLTVGRSTDLAASLEARGFGLSIPPLTLRARPRDAAALFAVALWVAASWSLVPGGILGP